MTSDQSQNDSPSLFPLRELKRISNDEMEALYALAYRYYHAHQFQDALRVFTGLISLDHLNARYWFGLGATHQCLGAPEIAIKYHAIAALLDLHDPRPPFAAAECYLACGNIAAAESALLAVEYYAPNDARGNYYRDKARKLHAELHSKEATL